MPLPSRDSGRGTWSISARFCTVNAEDMDEHELLLMVLCGLHGFVLVWICLEACWKPHFPHRIGRTESQLAHYKRTLGFKGGRRDVDPYLNPQAPTFCSDHLVTSKNTL